MDLRLIDHEIIMICSRSFNLLCLFLSTKWLADMLMISYSSQAYGIPNSDSIVDLGVRG